MRVDGPQGLHSGNAQEARPERAAKSAGAQAAGHDEQPEDAASGAPSAPDTIEISDHARQLMESLANTNQGQTAGIRPEMVERARKVLQAGTYNDAGVIDKTAARIAQILSADA